MNKEDFLNKLRKNTHVQFDMPAVDVKGIQYEDTLKQFIEMTESVGGHVIEAKEGESLNSLRRVGISLHKFLTLTESVVVAACLGGFLHTLEEQRHHFAIKEKNENIWIAQREGRAKDSDDRTQKSILQMMAMGGEGSVIDRLKQLHLVPLSISYEYDPCDFLKAQEYQLKRDVEGWKKGPMDDLVSMQTGIFGYKGHVHYHAAPCLDEYLDSLDPEMPKQELFTTIASHIDHEVHSNYRLYPGNYVALDLLENTEAHVAEYTAEDKARFEKYIAGQLAKIQLPNKDEAFLKEKILTMYANPVRNFLATK